MWYPFQHPFHLWWLISKRRRYRVVPFVRWSDLYFIMVVSLLKRVIWLPCPTISLNYKCLFTIIAKVEKRYCTGRQMLDFSDFLLCNAFIFPWNLLFGNLGRWWIKSQKKMLELWSLPNLPLLVLHVPLIQRGDVHLEQRLARFFLSCFWKAMSSIFCETKSWGLMLLGSWLIFVLTPSWKGSKLLAGDKFLKWSPHFLTFSGLRGWYYC